MPPLSHPLQFLVVALAGWINQQQREVIDYLQAENRVLREQLGPRRLRLTDDQRVRLMGHAKVDTTLNVYTQVMDGALRTAVDRIGSELFTIVHNRKEGVELTCCVLPER
jgi:hypothetical protein